MKAKRSRNGYTSLCGLALIFGIFLLVGCSGGGGGGGAVGSPSIALDRASIDFSNQLIGQTAEQWVTVRNTGTANLSISLTAPGDGFAVTSTSSSVAPGDTCDVIVRFTPTVQQSYAGSFNINSNASNASSVPVSLLGEGKSFRVTIDHVDTSGHNQIRLLVTVTDGNNAPIDDLTEPDFSVYEKADPDPVVFDSWDYIETNKLAVATALDYSGSIEDYKQEVEDSTRAFINSLIPGDEAALLKFVKEVQVMQPFTSDLIAVRNSVADPYTLAMGGTAFNDAVYKSAELVGLRLDADPLFRGIAVILSDGLEWFSSTYTLDQAIDKAKAEGVTIFTIGFGDTYLRGDVLQRVANETNGRYLEAPTKTDIEAMYAQISQILGNQYEIVFTTNLPQGEPSVELKVVVEDIITGEQGEDTEVVDY